MSFDDEDSRSDDQHAECRREIERLSGLINTPETRDFLEGAVKEAAHQVERWGEAHDRRKTASEWFWLLGYLSGKALAAALAGDTEKARHHCISSAAMLAQWHAALLQPTAEDDGNLHVQERTNEEEARECSR